MKKFFDWFIDRPILFPATVITLLLLAAPWVIEWYRRYASWIFGW